MLVTPSTANVHGGTSRPSRAAYGSTQPPMHASTWQRTPALGAAAGDLGDRVDDPVGVRRRARHHEHRAVVDRARPSRPGRPGSPRRPAPAPARPRSSARPCGTPRARCIGSTMRGRSTSGRASRAACTASSTDSVPPEVTVPTTSGGASSSRAREADQLVLHRAAGSGTRSGPARWTPAYAATACAADLVGLGQPAVVDVGQRAAAVRRQVARPASPAAGRARRRSWNLLRVSRRLLRELLDDRDVERVAAQPHQAQQREQRREQREAEHDRGHGRRRLRRASPVVEET